ncbi:MAG: hypothetical protein KAV70_03525 [Bacteroidales bacterium]|nr:hypothetical protein [Bacteroidales bacterium]
MGKNKFPKGRYMNLTWSKLLIIIGFLPFLFFFISCDKFESDQTIPSYLHIDSIGLVTDYDLQGTASHSIVDVWVYVDDDLIGIFELPATLPVLKEGIHKLTLKPGIKMNGIAATRIPYPFYESIIYENFNFIIDNIDTVNPTTQYMSNTQFTWMEDFESGSISLEPTTKSDTTIDTTSYNSPLVFQGHYSGVSYLDGSHYFLEIATKDSYELPGLGSPVFLELNFKINNLVTIGIYTQSISQIEQIPIIILNNTDSWKKIYINFTPTVSGSTDAVDFKVYFQASKEIGVTQAKLLFDNIKLIHR